MSEKNNSFDNWFDEVWSNVLSNFSEEEQEQIKNLEPKEIIKGVILYLINPINWFRLIFAFISGVFIGISKFSKKINN
jgi:hypothetical protein